MRYLLAFALLLVGCSQSTDSNPPQYDFFHVEYDQGNVIIVRDDVKLGLEEPYPYTAFYHNEAIIPIFDATSVDSLYRAVITVWNPGDIIWADKGPERDGIPDQTVTLH